MQRCDYKTCQAEATTKGYVFGRVKGSGDDFSYLPVNACDDDKKIDGFFEEIDGARSNTPDATDEFAKACRELKRSLEELAERLGVFRFLYWLEAKLKNHLKKGR
ncbi:hypothetical protein [Paenibacillus gorillae]|uniref:hypothetical protein n=1 Tax=Paenibacillus gorillae TaxID=1243662 RepID=UPI0004ACF2AE|nr:hypothetical protein [Paenibacillus gorillae]